jgi:hypothetical protein
MKRILLLICLLALPIKAVLGAPIPMMGAQKESTESVAPIKPIKVSEINANLFSAMYDFLGEAGAEVFEGFVSLKDFVEVGEWFIESFQTPDMRNQLASFSVRFMFVFFLSFVFAQGLSAWLKPKAHTFLKCKEQPFSEKLNKLVLAAPYCPLFCLAFCSILFPG